MVRTVLRPALPLLLLLALSCCHAYAPPSAALFPRLGHLGRRAPAAQLLAKTATKKLKKTAATASSGGGGFGKASDKTSSPKPEQLLKKAMALYDQLDALRNQQNAAEAAKLEVEEGDSGGAAAAAAAAAEPQFISVSKYAVALRSSAPAAAEISDWVPVALLAVASESADPNGLVPSAVGASVKEILEGACLNFPSLRKVPRETLQYATEPLDSFESHVYEGLQGRAERRAEAKKTLGIEGSASAAEVKRAHRKLMQQLHPDSFVGDEEGAEEAKARMLDVQAAYGELGGGQGAGSGSFYQRIGGKARVGFSGALPREALAPLGRRRAEQEAAYSKGGWRVGVMPMATSITQEFRSRNLLRANGAAD